MKKLFLLVLSFMLILSMSVVFINVGNIDFTGIPVGSVSQSPVGAEITVEDEGAVADVVATGANVGNSITATLITSDTTWNLTSTETTLSNGTVTISNGATLTITASSLTTTQNRIRLKSAGPNGRYGPFFIVNDGASLVINGNPSPNSSSSNGNILFESADKISESAAIVVNNANIINLTNVTFCNHKSTFGGALYLDGECNDLDINSCKFWYQGGSSDYENTMETSAIWMTPNFRYKGAENTSAIIQNSVFDNCYATFGGSIRYQGTSENVTDLTIINNSFTKTSRTLKSSSGGFISIEGSNSGVIEISGNKMSKADDCTAGGAIYISNYSNATVTLGEGNDISECTATHGGAVYCGGGTLNVTGGEYYQNNAGHGGGGIYVSDTEDSASHTYFNMSGGNIYNNKADTAGGGIYLVDGIEGAYSITGGNIYSNSSKQYAGGIFVHGTYATFEGENLNVHDNHAAVGGAIGLWVDARSATLDITGGNFYNNYAVKGASINSNSKSIETGNGGCIWLGKESDIHSSDNLLGYYATLNISGGKFYKNYINGSGAKGGAIFGDTDSVINITGGTVGDDSGDNSWDNRNHVDNGYGGAVYQNNGTLNISGENTLIKNNAALNGGAIYAVGGTFNMTGGKIAIGVANNNSSDTAGYGGGVYVSDCDAVTMTDGEITECSAGNHGGGISIHGSKVDKDGNPAIQIKGGKILKNKASNNGGGIYIHNDTKAVIGGNVKISENYIVLPADASVYDNDSDYRGGGIFASTGSTAIIADNATITENSALMGAGIYFQDAESAVIRGKIINDEISTEENDWPLITKNKAEDSGGGIAIDGGTLEISGAIISENIAKVEDVITDASNQELTGTANFGGGGILMWLERTNSSLDFNFGKMVKNSAWEGSGGAICSSRKYNTNTNQGFIKINGGSFTGNGAGNGGAIYSDYLTTLTMTGGTIGGTGGEVFDLVPEKTENPTIKDVSEYANYALGINDGDFGAGGGIYARGETELTNVDIIGNIASLGAGVAIGKSTYTSDRLVKYGSVTSKNCSYNYNYSTQHGGGVHVYGGSTTDSNGNVTRAKFVSVNDTIEKNESVHGGGIYGEKASLVDLTAVNINNNKLRPYKPSSKGQGQGGGLAIYGILKIKKSDTKNSEISNNYSDMSGGGIFTYPVSQIEISGTTIEGNTAANLGGGLYFTGGLTTEDTNGYTKLDNIIVKNNKVEYQYDGETNAGHGGGILVTAGSAYTGADYVNHGVEFSLTNSVIQGNECTGFGGGLYIKDFYQQLADTEPFSDNKFTNNKAGYGGGIHFSEYISSSSTYAVCRNNTVENNIADIQGGGIYSKGNVYFYGTIKNNTSKQLGGGVYVAQNHLLLESIVTGNKAIAGGGVYVGSGNTSSTSGGICTVRFVDGKPSIYENFADPVDGSSIVSQGDDIYSKGTENGVYGGRLYFPKDPATFDDGRIGIWYSDYVTDRFRTGPDLINNPTLLSTGKIASFNTNNYYSMVSSVRQEVATTFKVATAQVSLGEIKAIDPWGNEYDPQIKVSDDVYDSKYKYEFVICKDNLILTKEDFTGDYEFLAYSITDADGNKEIKHFKDLENGSIYVSAGETLSIGGLVEGLQIRMYTPNEIKILNSFIKSVNAQFDWSNNNLNIVTEKAKSGLYVVKRLTTSAIPTLNTAVKYNASITNNIFGAKVTINYYDRNVAKGVATDINNTPTTVTKTYLGPEYVYEFNNSSETDTIQLNNFSQMITGAGVAANNKARGIDNIIDKYYLWHSQAGAVAGVKSTIYPGTEKTYEAYLGSSVDYTKHTNAVGDFTSDSKWVTYYTASKKQEITPDVYKLDDIEVLDDFSKFEDIHSVNEIDVWLFNTPKVYNAKVYSAQRAGHLENYLGNGMYSSTNMRGNFSAYYNQRFNGEMGDETDAASKHLLKYNDQITGYIDEYISTSYRIRGVDGQDVFFQYWSYDPEGKIVASTDISYAHRVTADVELYAIYGQGEFWDTGLTLLGNTTDFYHIDSDSDGYADTEYVRFNTINTPYNSEDVNRAASIFFVFDSEDVNLNDSMLKQSLEAYLDTITDKGAYGIEDLPSNVKTQITLKDLYGKDINVEVVIDVYDIVESVDSNSDEHDITKTSLDRVQFNKEYKLEDVLNKTVISFGGMRDSDTWYVSNYVEYIINDDNLDFDVEGDLGVGGGVIEDW